MRRRHWAIWGAALVLALPVLATSTPAHAGDEPELRLLAQDPWTRIGQELHFQVRVGGASSGFTLAVITHESLDDLDEFEQTSAGDELGQTHDLVRIPIEFLPADANGNRSVTVALEDIRTNDLTNRLGAPGAGVYPLEVELRDTNDDARARFVTFLVAVTAAGGTEGVVEDPLGVAWVWPLVTRPTLRADGTPDPEIVSLLQNDGRLGRQVLALARTRDIPVTLVPTPETMQTWTTLSEDDASVPDGADALPTLGLNAQILSGPYVAVNLPSLLRAGMTGAVDPELTEGKTALEGVFESVDATTALVNPVDNATLGRLRAGGVEQVIVDERALVERETELTPARPFRLDAPALFRGSEVNAVSFDRQISDLLTGDGAPALRAQRFLAALSVIAFEPTAIGLESEPRAVAVVNSRGFDVPESVLEAAFAGLRSHPWLRPMHVNDVFESVPVETTEDGTLIRELADIDPPAPPVTAREYAGAQLRLVSFQKFAPDAPGMAWAEHALLSSVSSDWEGPALGEAPARLAAVDQVIRAFVSRINVPAPSTITLTDRSGDIPLTVRNSTGEPVQVEIVLQSPKLSFPNGAQQIVTLPRRNTTVRFAVESRTSGSFPLSLTVRSCCGEGTITIAQARFRVEATAVSTVGLILIISAVVFLAAWWLVHIRRERRRKRRRFGRPAPAP